MGQSNSKKAIGLLLLAIASAVILTLMNLRTTEPSGDSSAIDSDSDTSKAVTEVDSMASPRQFDRVVEPSNDSERTDTDNTDNDGADNIESRDALTHSFQCAGPHCPQLLLF